jgi:hypothetical protein
MIEELNKKSELSAFMMVKTGGSLNKYEPLPWPPSIFTA